MSTYSDLVLSLAPLAYYRLDETSGTVTTDSSTHGRHGTYGGSPVFGNAGLIEADADTCIDFDGINDYANIPPTGLNPTLLSVFAWVSWDSMGSTDPSISGKGVVVKEPDTGLNRDWELAVIRGNNVPAVQFTWGSSPNNGFVFAVVDPAPNVTHMLCAVRTTTETSLYFDGDLVAQQAHSLPIITRGDPVRIGVTGGIHPAQHFDGRIDEVAILDQALTPSQVRELWCTGWPTRCEAGWVVGAVTL